MSQSHTHCKKRVPFWVDSLCLGQCLLTGQDVDVSVLVLVVRMVGMLCSDVHVSRTALHFLGGKIIQMENLSVQKNPELSLLLQQLMETTFKVSVL